MRAPPALGNPRRLARVIDAVFAGTRRPAQVARQLDLEVRVVRAYLAHAAWMGMLAEPAEPRLLPLGLAFAVAGNKRPHVLAEVVAAHPVLSRLPADAKAAVATLEAEDLARRDARAILRLAAAARRPRASVAGPEQMHLAFAGPVAPRALPLDADQNDDSLDVYAVLLRALLEHGELRLNTIRGLLDEARAPEANLGGYVALAVRRGDATRLGDAVLATPGAVARADLAESVVSIALSDPDFRAWLADGRTESRRCTRWARRLFGAEAPAIALPRLLFGRRLESVPLAGEALGELPAEKGAFLDVSGERLAFSIPSSIIALGGGIHWVHEAWRAQVQQAGNTRPPSPLDARAVVHGGLFAPGVPMPRNIPDLLSLRLRAVRSVPAFAFLVGAGLLHRRRLLRLRPRGERLWVDLPGRDSVDFDTLVRRLARSRGWLYCRAPGRPRWTDIAETAASLGLLARARDLWVLDEALFARLGHDPEHHELLDRLSPLCDALERVAGP
ncbi:MAG: hypothetical protein FJ102_05735 [Deltaproteobacteria bacterium]|nr:hypothetical protein [Deltaproteobacteria bacterium]